MRFLSALFITPIIHCCFGKPSPHNVYQGTWMSNEHGNPYTQYQNDGGWITIGSGDQNRDGSQGQNDGGWITIDSGDRNQDGWQGQSGHYQDGRYSSNSNYPYGDNRQDWQNDNGRKSNNHVHKHGNHYHYHGNNGNVHGHYGNNRPSPNNAYENYWNAHGSSAATTKAPEKHDWRYYNNTVAEEEDESQDAKSAKIQATTKSALGNGWWYLANSDSRWDSITGDLWKNPWGSGETTKKPKPKSTTKPAAVAPAPAAGGDSNAPPSP